MSTTQLTRPALSRLAAVGFTLAMCGILAKMWPALVPVSPGTFAPYIAVIWQVGMLTHLVPLVGAIVSHVALGHIKRAGLRGRGLAIAGVVLGWLFAAWFYIPLFLFTGLMWWAGQA